MVKSQYLSRIRADHYALAGNIKLSNWDIVGGPKGENNRPKMAAAAILENTQKGVFRPILDRCAPNYFGGPIDIGNARATGGQNSIIKAGGG